jgi:hypothetical protein
MTFMVGDMGATGPYDSKSTSERIEAALDSGSKYYTTAFPRESLLESMRRFTEEVMPSYK